MATGNNQKTWLNIMIIVIAALVLAFTLLGRFLDRGEQQHDNQQSHQSPSAELTAIDFGNVQLLKTSDDWIAQPEDAVKISQIRGIIEQWQGILSSELKPQSIKGQPVIQSATTVLIYLAGQANPLIVKLVISRQKSYLFFVATGLQIEIEADLASRLLPPSTEASSNNPITVEEH